MDTILLTFKLLVAASGQKHHSEAKNGMKESINWKSFQSKLLYNLKTPWRVQSDLSYDLS